MIAFAEDDQGETGGRVPLFRGLLTQRAWPCELVDPEAPVAAYALSSQGWSPRTPRELRSRGAKNIGDPVYVVNLNAEAALKEFSETEVRLLSGEQHPASSTLGVPRPPSPR